MTGFLSENATLLERMTQMNQDMLDLLREVQETKTVIGSANALMDGLSAQLKEAIAANDMSAVKQAVADLDAAQADLAAGVARNTAAATEPVPPVVPPVVPTP